MKIKIQNGSNAITIDIGEAELLKFISQIKDCLGDKRQFIEYEDKSDFIIFSAQYLKNSLITFPKETEIK